MVRTAQTRRARVPARDGESLPLKARRHPLVAMVDRELRRCEVGAGSGAKRAKVVVGVSGGADSTALLLACTAIARRRNPKDAFVEPIAVHVHHHLRPSADAEAQCVSKLCKRLGVELHVRHVRPALMNGNVSANARKLRYDALANVAAKREARFVAVAHHAEDQLETMLMAICRGTGIHGLAAMASSRPLAEHITLVRPLLRVRKAECEDLCRAAGVAWVEDPSNVDVNRARARMRRDVLPALDELWPGAARRASAAAEVADAAAAALEHWLDESFGPPSQREWDRSAINRLPAAVIGAGLRRAALRLVPSVADALGQDQLLDAARAVADDVRRPRRFEWPGGLACVVNSRLVRIDAAPSRGKTSRRTT
jgi:tRNA(Ile)-lysidine synthase